MVANLTILSEEVEILRWSLRLSRQKSASSPTQESFIHLHPPSWYFQLKYFNRELPYRMNILSPELSMGAQEILGLHPLYLEKSVQGEPWDMRVSSRKNSLPGKIGFISVVKEPTNVINW